MLQISKQVEWIFWFIFSYVLPTATNKEQYKKYLSTDYLFTVLASECTTDYKLLKQNYKYKCQLWLVVMKAS